MQIVDEVKLDFNDVLIRPKRSESGSRADIDLLRSFTTLNSKQVLIGIPIFASNMDATGTMKMHSALSNFQLFTCLHKFYSVEDLVKYFPTHNAFYTLGITDFDKLKKVAKRTRIDRICLDVANGYTKFFVDKVKRLRELFPEAIIMAGNVATPDMVQELLISGGADIIKIGIGPGKVCQTRLVTGVGYYQLSAIIECADAAHGVGGLICADGGCSTSGDVCKAFGAGADFVMLGSMLAGHDECEGEWECTYEYKKNFKFYGMSSKEAMDKYYGGVAKHRASEGTCILIPYKGPVENTINEILGGIRSACTYIGASKLKDFSKCTTFVKNK